jgi:uncharacterized repeat protein (TIGR01451 family)
MSRFFLVLTLLAGFLAVPAAQPARADTAAQPLPLAQDWSNTGLITTNDIWSGVLGITGYLGDYSPTASPTGVDPQTVLTPTTTVDVIANQTSPNTFFSGGVAEFHIADPVVALQGSGTADAPSVNLFVNTTGWSSITVAYNLRDIDGSTDNAVQQVALQFRVGNTGDFTNVPAGYVADATTGPSLATLVTPVSAMLPAAADNQSLVEIRIITANAVGNDEWVGVDDIWVGPTETNLVAGKTGPVSADIGQPVTYTLTVANEGWTPASDVTITDTLPADVDFVTYTTGLPVSFQQPSAGTLVWNLGSLGVFSGTQTITLNGSVASGAVAGTRITNTVEIGMAAVEAVMDDNSAEWGLTVGAPDLALTKTGPATAQPGELITYTLNITNNGSLPATGLWVTDTLPLLAAFAGSSEGAPDATSGQQVGWSLAGTLNASDVITVTVEVTVSASAVTGNSLVNSALVTSLETDADSSDNASQFTTLIAGANPYVEKALGSVPRAGQVASYMVVYGNDGTAAATGVLITDTLPAGVTAADIAGDTSGLGATDGAGTRTWSVPSLGVGDRVTFTLAVTLPTGLAPQTVLTNSVTLAADSAPNDDPSDDQASAGGTAALPIHDIQGLGHVSPYSGTVVYNVAGIVTARRSSSFYLQDTLPDADPGTSEAILVYSSGHPAQVGDYVAVLTGTVTEYYADPDYEELSITELQANAANIRVLASGQPLPAPTVIGAGGRVPPAQVIEDDVTGNVETSGTFDAASDGIDFYESLEAMRVQVNDALAVAATNSFKEIAVVPDNGISATVLSPRDTLVLRPGDFNPERILLDDTLMATPNVSAGAVFSGAAIGVLDYTFGNSKLFVTSLPAATASPNTAETTTAATSDQLTVASYNVYNLDPSDPPARFAALGQHIATNLRAPDIVVLEEVQDNSGETDNGVVEADVTASTLIAAITGAGGPAYVYTDVAPTNNADGGAPGGNIRVGFLYNPARVSLAASAGGRGTATDAVSLAAGPHLSYNPGRIDPANPAWTNSRVSVAAEFVFNGQSVFVIGNHLKSKSEDAPLYGRFQPPNLRTEAQRLAQAQVVNGFVDSLLAAALPQQAYVVVAGDMNEFQFNPAVLALGGDALSNLTDSLPENDRYSYVFDGNAQTLDHILVTPGLSRTAQYDQVHVNSDLYYASSARPSDHDPVVARLTLQQYAPDLALTKTGPASAQRGEPITYTLVITNNGNLAATGLWITDTLPSLVTLTGSSEGAPDAASGQQVGWSVGGSLLPGQSVAITVTVVVSTSAVAGNALVNSAQVTSFEPDASSADNTSQATTTIWGDLPYALYRYWMPVVGR